MSDFQRVTNYFEKTLHFIRFYPLFSRIFGLSSVLNVKHFILFTLVIISVITFSVSLDHNNNI